MEEKQQNNDTKSNATTPIINAPHNIHCLTIIGQIEGHNILPSNNKTTRYEDILPTLINIEENASSLQNSKTQVVNEKKNEVKVTNSVGEFTTTIKILPPTNARQHRVVPVDTIDGNLLWEPTLVNGDHAVSINRNHDFYLKVYGPNLDNSSLIQGLDSMLWGLAEAELSTYNEDTREQYEEMRNQVSRILKKLVKELPDPDTE